jgi:predicted AlkP superfamily phosphohydrolase/phosphomutase
MRTLIIGLDAFDPAIFEHLLSEGKMPHLSKFVEADGYSRFSVVSPPQSEVSWSSIATGLNPGGHGIFDFVHRDPASYGLQVSLLPTRTSLLGTQFIPPHQATTIFDETVNDGYPATSLWWPATFPARLASPVRTIPGLGAPDIFGRLGVGFFFSTMHDLAQENRKTSIGALVRKPNGGYGGELEGPSQKTLSGVKRASLEFELEMVDSNAAHLTISQQRIDLKLGQWSPIFELGFKAGFGVSIRAITRAILVKANSEPELYLLPLQAHPLQAPWPFATPKGFVQDLWTTCGPFLTLGWPQDTTALEEGIITDEQFLTLCEQICTGRELALMHLIGSFKEGLLACVFDSLDRLQHMFWKDRKDILESWYIRLDALVGRVEEKIASTQGKENPRLLIVSDHGFGEFNYKVHLNRWLVNHGYLMAKETGEAGDLKGVDWKKSQAYALGLNSLYLNLEGREIQGVVTFESKTELIRKLCSDLKNWNEPDGQPVVRGVLTQVEAFQGPLAEYGPDLVIGYHTKYRASAETGLGQWKAEEIEVNRDHWGGDHCFDAREVPGVLFSSDGLHNLPNPCYSDIPVLAIDKALHPNNSVPPPTYSGEDQETIEKRLKDLGYL